jgi:hypothetical protein
MILQESGLIAHTYLVCLVILLLLIFIFYLYTKHKKYIRWNNQWNKIFHKVGLSANQIKQLSHDDNVWYYQGVSTCVGYGDWENKCDTSLSVCSGGDTYGKPLQQAISIKKSIDKGGEHDLCPLLYRSIS